MRPEGEMPMQLEHLALFLKIAQEKSISKVANASHISQPALSLQMQKVEDALGCRLFERSNRGIQLTEAGNITKRYAAQLMFTFDQFMEELHNLRNNNDTCRVAATQAAANYAIPCTLVKAKEKFPDFIFTLAPPCPSARSAPAGAEQPGGYRLHRRRRVRAGSVL